jgi:putative cardiolipin synthase
MKFNYRHILVVLLFLLIGGCASLPTDVERPTSLSFSQPQTTALGRLVIPLQSLYPETQSGFYILDTGREAFLERLALIEAAEQSIDAQYYIWNSDESGRYIAQRLLLAADRGVRVRILLDDVSIGDRDEVIASLNSHPQINVRIYNPFAERKGKRKWLSAMFDFSRLNRRMHNKTFVVDGAFGIVGGRNIGNEYFDMASERGMNFRDRDILAAGPIVAQISSNFDAYWNSSWAFAPESLIKQMPDQSEVDDWLEGARSFDIDIPMLNFTIPKSEEQGLQHLQDTLTQIVWAEAELIYDQPVPADVNDTDSPKQTAQELGKLVRAAKKEVLIESAYFILVETQLDYLQKLTEGGVKVKALTNSLAANDLTTNHAGYARRRKAMLMSGLQLYEFRPDAASCRFFIADEELCNEQTILGLHAKSMVFDREILYIGSFNINLRSAFLNTETVLIIHSQELAEQVAVSIKTNMLPENSWAVNLNEDHSLYWEGAGSELHHHEPDTSWWRRFKSGFIGLFPLEKYL